ncbi:MAG TPA: hypothetical protein VM431_08895 [Phycisphaerae bacterium]|nr:hypothetical protein [Phycisphaerae bacterium]
MNNRGKILAGAVGLFGVGLIAYLSVDHLFLIPAAQRFNQARDLVEKIDLARAERDMEASYRTRLKTLAGATFGTDELKVSEKIRSRIAAVLTQSGLTAERLTLKPLVGARVPGIYREVGWMVAVHGSLSRIVDFLYLMTKEPHLHRLGNLVITPTRGTTDVELQVKYVTLVLHSPKGEDLVTATVAEGPDAAVLEGPERRQVQLIASRDIFRPYIAASRPEPTAPTPTPTAPSSPQAPQVPVGRYRLVGLPTWGGRPDVLIRDSASGNIASYKTGDELGGGTIVTVDYRSMPTPSKPEILSGSRVVLRVGSEYYAVELGRSLEEKYPLRPDQVPPGLPKLEPPSAETPTPAEASP